MRGAGRLILSAAILLAALAPRSWAASKDRMLPRDKTLINDVNPAEAIRGIRVGQKGPKKKSVPLKSLLRRFAKEKDRFKKDLLLEEIARAGLRAGKPLRGLALRGRSRLTRAMAFRGLGMVRYYDALPELRRALTDRHSWIRSSAAWSLGELRADAAVPDLTRRLKKEKRAVVVEAIVYALERIGAKGELPVIRKAAGHSSPFTRSWVLRTVVRLGGKSEIKFAAGFLEDMNLGVQETAVEVLGELTGKDFGLPDNSYEDVSPAIQRARDWWETKGRYE